MNENIQYLDMFITYMVVICSMAIWKKFFKRPIVWIIDDSITDQTMLKIKLKQDTYQIRYFNNAKGLINEYLKSKLGFSAPSAVVVDYFLNDGIDGKEVVNFFRNNEVDTVMLTGYEGEISGIPSYKIIRKDSKLDYISKLEEWIHATV